MTEPNDREHVIASRSPDYCAAEMLAEYREELLARFEDLAFELDGEAGPDAIARGGDGLLVMAAQRILAAIAAARKGE